MKPAIQILLASLVTVSTVGNSAESDAEIVAKLEKMAAIYPSLVDAKPPEISPPTSLIEEWFRRKVFVNQVAFDVRRTDSLVSPYAGVISFTCDVRGTKGATRESVNSGPDTFHSTGGFPCTANYAYQSSRWVRKAVTCRSGVDVFEPRPERGVTYNCAQALPSD